MEKNGKGFHVWSVLIPAVVVAAAVSIWNPGNFLHAAEESAVEAGEWAEPEAERWETEIVGETEGQQENGNVGETGETEMEVPDGTVPLDGEIRTDRELTIQVIQVEDEDVPLADLRGPQSNIHKYCTLHYLLLAVSAAVFCLSVDNRRKHQGRILRLKEELAMERRRRDTGGRHV